MPYFIQGFYLQNREFLGLNCLSETEGGVTPVIMVKLCQYMFSGVIFPDPNGNLTGEMIDLEGISALSKIRLSEKEVSFIKKYGHRNDEINYSFKRKGAFWVGGYNGWVVGSGESRCIITEIADGFFQPLETQENLF